MYQEKYSISVPGVMSEAKCKGSNKKKGSKENKNGGLT
jgi:hypothetical protein